MLPKKFVLLLAGIGLLLLLIGAWFAWTVWQVNRDLNAAVDHADRLQRAVEAGDNATVDRELEALRRAGDDAVDGTSSPTWSVMAKLPVFGDDASGVRVASEVVRDLAADGIEPLVTVSDELDGLMPQDGKIRLDRLADLEAPVADARAAFVNAEGRLAAEDPSGYVGKLRDRYRDLHATVRKAARAMASAETAVKVLPSMLGEDEPRRYLLVFQNNAEIRATGGLPGAVTALETDGGELKIGRQVSGGDLGMASQPVLPMTKAETKQYDDVLGNYFVSSNMTPDVPRAAELMKARWEQVYPSDPIDGVLLIDTVAISYVLEATGPIEVDGVTLTADNSVDELLHNTYLRLDDPEEQDEFFAGVAATAFERFTSGEGDPIGVLRGVARATDERRIVVHSFDDQEQQQLSGTLIAGEFVTDPDVNAPQVDVTVNDTTGSKMSYFLRYDVDVTATYCSDGVQGLSGKARLWSNAPPDAADLSSHVTGGGNYGTEPGRQVVTYRIYGPVGGTVSDVTLNGSPMDVISVDQDGRPVAMTYLEMGPGEKVDLTWTMTSGEGQTSDAEVKVTPSIEPGSYSQTVASNCG